MSDFKKNFLTRSEVLQSQEMKYTLILKQNETLKKFALIINKCFSSSNFAIQKKQTNKTQQAVWKHQGYIFWGKNKYQLTVNYTCYSANNSFKSMAKSFNYVLGMFTVEYLH